MHSQILLAPSAKRISTGAGATQNWDIKCNLLGAFGQGLWQYTARLEVGSQVSPLQRAGATAKLGVSLVCSSKSCMREGSREHSLEPGVLECGSVGVSEGLTAELRASATDCLVLFSKTQLDPSYLAQF